MKVAQLLAGQAEIDRMRKAIDQVCAILLGVLTPLPDASTRNSEGKNLHWGWVLTRQTDEQTVINYYEFFADDEWDAVFKCASNFPGASKIHLSKVKDVYDALPLLLRQCLKEYPQALEKLKPFLDAAR